MEIKSRFAGLKKKIIANKSSTVWSVDSNASDSAFKRSKLLCGYINRFGYDLGDIFLFATSITI